MLFVRYRFHVQSGLAFLAPVIAKCGLLSYVVECYGAQAPWDASRDINSAKLPPIQPLLLMPPSSYSMVAIGTP